ncbi:hypothetical protein Sa4125_39090 [Aureimonas sp. SA4125]|uniref:hypothetical protein n=1 Tax=Aureimonas sp. SA4125 TaxID=2826993 RepID=UPI001CC3FA0A|nr:hypothetical protein [Aureimonas sp. SA4125]BDA86367.1 hypothetical protein Sa4125_39090 [Aureimonas sp. SA4125]
MPITAPPTTGDHIRHHIVSCICDDLRVAALGERPFQNLASAVGEILHLCDGREPLSSCHQRMIRDALVLYESEIENQISSGAESVADTGIGYERVADGLTAFRRLVDHWACPPGLRLPRQHPDLQDAKDRARILESLCTIESLKGRVSERRQKRRAHRNRALVAEIAAALGVAMPAQSAAPVWGASR